jgi:excisionase family DNA binding protein
LAQAYLMVARGEIRTVRSGRAILIPKKAVQEFLDGGAA